MRLSQNLGDIISKVQVTINVLLEDKINPKRGISIINPWIVPIGGHQVIDLS